MKDKSKPFQFQIMECTAIFLITCFMCRFTPPKRFHSASCMRSSRKTYDPPLLTGPSPTSKSWKPYILVLHLNSTFLLMCFVTVVACALCSCLWRLHLSCLHLILLCSLELLWEYLVDWSFFFIIMMKEEQFQKVGLSVYFLSKVFRVFQSKYASIHGYFF